MAPTTLQHADFFAIESLLRPEEARTLGAVREWLRDAVRPIAVDHWNRSEFPMHLIPQIAELDIMSPVRRLGHSHLCAGLLAAEIHRTDASVGTFFSGHDGLFTGSIELLASEEQQREWLPDIHAVRKTGVFAITEPQAGSDVAGGLTTSAERDGDSWVLNGTKRWIGNATFSDYVLVYAKDVADGQVKGFLVDTRLPGYSATLIEHRIALRAVQNADVVLDGVRIPADHKLAHSNSFRDVNRVFTGARAVVGWQAVGLQLAAFDLARDHAITRHQFGKPLAAFQLVQQHISNILANVTTSMATMAQVARLQDAGAIRPEHTALAKATVTKLARESVSIARALLGGNGIDTAYEIGKVFSDTEALFTYEGTFEINSLIAARSVTGVSAFV